MKHIIFLLVFFGNGMLAQTATPMEYWTHLTMGEKVAFINGAYSTAAKLKYFHKQEVRKQYKQDPSWVQPYYIERFYEVVDEHRSEKVGYNIEIIAKAMDAFYSNYDNANIPVMEALRVVSLSQDGKQEKANLYLLLAQRKYK